MRFRPIQSDSDDAEVLVVLGSTLRLPALPLGLSLLCDCDPLAVTVDCESFEPVGGVERCGWLDCSCCRRHSRSLASSSFELTRWLGSSVFTPPAGTNSERGVHAHVLPGSTIVVCDVRWTQAACFPRG